MRSVLRLPVQYDTQRLVADLATAERIGQYHDHYNAYKGESQGGWNLIPLVSRGGGTDPNSSLDFGRYVKRTGLRVDRRPPPFQKTAVLKQCPYFDEVVDSFQCEKRRVRLLRLEPGAKVRKHHDPGESWAGGQPRLHIPIVTHEDVHFHLDRQRIIMKPGELWYCDFSRQHWVENRSPVSRVHLMLELVVNDWLRQLFPAESPTERASNWVYYAGLRIRWKVAAGARRIQQGLESGRQPSASPGS